MYIIANESALLLVFLHLRMESGGQGPAEIPGDRVGSGFLCNAPLLLKSCMAFRWRMWHVFALVHLAKNCCSGFTWNKDSIGIKRELLPLRLSATLSTF